MSLVNDEESCPSFGFQELTNNKEYTWVSEVENNAAVAPIQKAIGKIYEMSPSFTIRFETAKVPTLFIWLNVNSPIIESRAHIIAVDNIDFDWTFISLSLNTHKRSQWPSVTKTKKEFKKITCKENKRHSFTPRIGTNISVDVNETPDCEMNITEPINKIRAETRIRGLWKKSAKTNPRNPYLIVK